MFTGIIESSGRVESVSKLGSGKCFTISSPLSEQFKVDQSVSHNGVCLTIEKIQDNTHQVTAILETLNKTTLAGWKPGTNINLERCMQMNGRLDGHIVQGHVDTTGICTYVNNLQGSWEYQISFPESFSAFIIEKGSICVDGISLTAYNVGQHEFSVAIIPYTYEHTNIGGIQPGDQVNLEFDVLGKYIQRHLSLVKSYPLNSL